MRILVTRPEPDATAFAERIRQIGHEALVAPLLALQLLPEPSFDIGGVQALLATSRNAVRGVEQWRAREGLLGLPLYVVGSGTAELAREAGFRQVIDGPRAGAELAALVASKTRPSTGSLLHLSGADLAFDLCGNLRERGFACERLQVYCMQAAATFPVAVKAALRAGEIDAVVLMSPETARIYVRLLREIDAEAAKLTDDESRAILRRPQLLCLSEAVAASAQQAGNGERMGSIRTAIRPRADDLLALIATNAADLT